MTKVLSLNIWRAHRAQNRQPPPNPRDDFNNWVARHYASLCLPPLPDRITHPQQREEERQQRIKELLLTMPPDYPGKASANDWKIALNNAVC